MDKFSDLELVNCDSGCPGRPRRDLAAWATFHDMEREGRCSDGDYQEGEDAKGVPSEEDMLTGNAMSDSFACEVVRLQRYGTISLM